MVGPPSQAPPGSELPSAPESTASPDWRGIPFEVPCGRCGQPLNGLDIAQCPACRLTFAWQDVLPIEQLRCRACGYRLFGLSAQRCPECG